MLIASSSFAFASGWLMDFYVPPEWSGPLRNLYWFHRNIRVWQATKRRESYRLIRAERDRLEACGINRELLRLMCRWLSEPGDRFALDRLVAFQTRMESHDRMMLFFTKGVPYQSPSIGGAWDARNDFAEARKTA